jgi:hypothetical protein
MVQLKPPPIEWMSVMSPMAGCILIIGYPDIIAGIWMKLKMRMDGTENARCKNSRRYT